MFDVPSALGAVIVILFTAVVRSYSRNALWMALVGSAALYVLLMWRHWFGDAYWGMAVAVLCGALYVSIAAAAWAWITAPPSINRFISELTAEDEWAVHNLWSATNKIPTGEARTKWLTDLDQWDQRVLVLMDRYQIPYEDQKDVRVLGNLVEHYYQYAPQDPDLTHQMVMLDVRRKRIKALLDRLRSKP